MLDEREYAAVLMDIQMPGMDGYQTTQRIRQNPRFRSDRLPVIAMTAHAMASERQRAIEAELNDYVPKPVEILKLAAVLERWITETSPGQTQTGRNFPEQTPAPPTAATAFDVLAALKRLGGDVNLYKRLLAVFQKDHALDVHHIRAAWQDEDMVLAGRLAHSLRSAAATLGAERLAHTAGLLESAVPGRDEALFNDLLAQLERRLAEAMQEAWRLSGEI
jgi:CheY-like chemotaxis protein